MPSKPTQKEKQADIKIIKLGSKQQIVDLENFYVNARMDNLDEIVEQKKNQVVAMLSDKELLDKVDINNSYLVSLYFFKSLNPLPNTEPDYSSEKLAIVWQLYIYLVEQVNLKLTVFKPTLSHFCKFAGISLATMRNLRNSPDLQMRTLVEKIYDEVFDSNMTLAETGVLNGRSTQFRRKSENELQEKPQVRVSVNINDEINLSAINSKIAQYSKFSEKKTKTLEADFTEVNDE